MKHNFYLFMYLFSIDNPNIIHCKEIQLLLSLLSLFFASSFNHQKYFNKCECRDLLKIIASVNTKIKHLLTISIYTNVLQTMHCHISYYAIMLYFVATCWTTIDTD